MTSQALMSHQLRSRVHKSFSRIPSPRHLPSHQSVPVPPQSSQIRLGPKIVKQKVFGASLLRSRINYKVYHPCATNRRYGPPINFRSIFFGYFTSRGAKSQDGYHAITPVCVDICPPIIFVEKKQSQLKSFTFSSLLFYMEEKQTRFVKSSDKAGRKCCSGKYKKVNKICSQRRLKGKKVTGRLSDCESLFHMTVCQVFVQSQ